MQTVATPSPEAPQHRTTLGEFRLQWRLMNAYERFEQLVVVAVGLIIAGVIVSWLLRDQSGG